MKLRHRQQGIGGMIIIAILVVLALVGSYIVATISSQQMATALSWRGMQAWGAAQAGADWAMARLQAGNDCSDIAGSNLFTVDTFSISIVNCTRFPAGTDKILEDGKQYSVFHYTAIAQGGSAGFDQTSRRIAVVVYAP